MRNEAEHTGQWWLDGEEHHPPTQGLRAQLADDMAKYLANGGAITVIPAGVGEGVELAPMHTNGHRNIIIRPERDTRRDLGRDAA